MKALKKYDPEKGFRLSTYATWWIRQTITRAIADRGRAIRVPVHMHDEIRELVKVRSRLTQKLQHEPTDAELADYLSLDESVVSEMLNCWRKPVSLNWPVDGEDSQSIELGDQVQDESQNVPVKVEIAELNEQVAALLSQLDERSRTIIILRFGFFDGKEYTLEEVGQMCGVTRERVRQLEATALKYLRLKANRDKLE